MATVVQLMRWRASFKAKWQYLKRARTYFTGLTLNKHDNDLFLNLLYRKTVHKTELFQLLPEQNRLKVQEDMVDALQTLAQIPLQQPELPEEIKKLRMAKDEKLKVGLVVQTLSGSLVSVFISVFA